MSTVPAATDEGRERPNAASRRDWRLIVGRALWVANLAALAVLVAWIAADGRFSLAVAGSQIRYAAADGWRNPTLLLLIAVAGVTTVGIFVTLFIGASMHRQLRSWFAYTMLVAAWLAVAVGWQEITWHGQRLRLKANLPGFETVAASLRKNWPTHDGDNPNLGAFMAYPQGKPRMLMLLVPPELPESKIAFSAVERGDNGSLRFELAGSEVGSWLEWHPAGSQPVTFTGGLENEYQLDRSSPLGDGWYLTRYR